MTSSILTSTTSAVLKTYGDKTLPKLSVDTETTGLEPWNGHYPFVITLADEQGNTVFARLLPGEKGADPEKGASDCRLPGSLERLGHLPSEGRWAVRGAIKGLETIEAIKRVLSNPNVVKIFHNAKFDRMMLRHAGFEINGPFHDTMIMARLVFPDIQSVSLKSLARFLFKVKYQSEEALHDWFRTSGTKKFYHAPGEILEPYASDDAKYTMALFRGLHPKIRGRTYELYLHELQLVDIIIRMETRGMLCDLGYAKKQAHACRAYQAVRQERVDRLNGGAINLNSPKQLQGLLFEKLQLHRTLSPEDRSRYESILRTPNGSYSTKREVLKIYKHPVIQDIMEYRMFGKMGGTYFEKFLTLADRGGVIHPTFWQSGTRTGRFSGSNPSFQTIPSITSGRLLDFDRDKLPNVRQCFITRPGYHMYAPDFSQIELRIAAWYAGEERMIQAFIDGEDIHDATTKAIFPDSWEDEDHPGKIDKPKRTFCKMVNFGVLYGMGIGKLSSDLGVPIERARSFLARYFSTYPGLRELMRKCQADIAVKGYVESIYGRQFRPDISKAYKGLNYLIQGTAADVMKRSLIRLDTLRKNMDLDLYILNTVHDEMIFEIAEGQDTPEFHEALKYELESWPEFDPVPITVNCKKVIGYWGNHEEVW